MFEKLTDGRSKLAYVYPVGIVALLNTIAFMVALGSKNAAVQIACILYTFYNYTVLAKLFINIAMRFIKIIDRLCEEVEEAEGG